MYDFATVGLKPTRFSAYKPRRMQGSYASVPQASVDPRRLRWEELLLRPFPLTRTNFVEHASRYAGLLDIWRALILDRTMTSLQSAR